MLAGYENSSVKLDTATYAPKLKLAWHVCLPHYYLYIIYIYIM